ncbi:hypothetical protein RHSIM_Rhsim09G0045500 [Rhododendron simsii]|uniref:Uncharacterized protein n=1 Tax=Rhododendron simsii TaxID=118357 RepID=A0A834GHZ8_RHOSS|nr:hypothetical protein RHSIM_Rhsim09G0045500 [Rhododendron simsii]
MITPQVHVADINRALAFNGQGTHLAGRARVAQVLFSYWASYSEIIDRRTRAADNPDLLAPSSSNHDQGRSSRSQTPPFPDKPIQLAEEASSLTSSDYSPSPPQEMNQPINLSNLLTNPGAGRGRDTARGRRDAQGHGRQAFIQSDAPPGFSPSEVAESHHDKRQRIESSTTGTIPPEGTLTTRRTTASNEDVAEEEDSLDRELNAHVSE